MTNTAQIDRIVSEVNDLEKGEKIIFFDKIEEMIFLMKKMIKK